MKEIVDAVAATVDGDDDEHNKKTDSTDTDYTSCWDDLLSLNRPTTHSQADNTDKMVIWPSSLQSSQPIMNKTVDQKIKQKLDQRSKMTKPH